MDFKHTSFTDKFAVKAQHCKLAKSIFLQNEASHLVKVSGFLEFLLTGSLFMINFKNLNI